MRRGSPFHLVLVGAAALLSTAACLLDASSQEGPASDLAAPEGAPPLPEDSKAPPVIINAANAATWKALLPPELAPSVRAGEITLAARQKLEYLWRIGDEWDAQSRRNAERNSLALVSGSTALRAEVAFNGGFPFGGESEVLRESTPELVGARALWNAQSVWWGQGSLEGQFDVTWTKGGRPVRVLRGALLRAYPALLGGAASAQIFREKVEFSTPSAISGLTWLSYRFLGNDEDVVWFYSTALEKARQLTGSNRSDALARGAISADDLLVWSGKVELVDAVADRSLVGLVPFAGLGLGQLDQGEAGCFEAIRGGLGDEAVSSPDDPGAFVSNAVFAPRRLWRIELTSNDPYSLYGRQVVYVDKGSMLPVYKFVYDRSGHLWKSVIGVFGLGMTADRGARAPYAAGQLVIDHLNDETDILQFTRFRVCRTPNDRTAAKSFDPRRLWPQPTPAPEKKGPVKK